MFIITKHLKEQQFIPKKESFEGSNKVPGMLDSNVIKLIKLVGWWYGLSVSVWTQPNFFRHTKKIKWFVFQSTFTGVMYQCPRDWDVLIIGITANLALSETNSTENSLDVLEIFN